MLPVIAGSRCGPVTYELALPRDRDRMIDTLGELTYSHTTYGGLTTTNYYEVTPYNPGTSPWDY